MAKLFGLEKLINKIFLIGKHQGSSPWQEQINPNMFNTYKYQNGITK